MVLVDCSPSASARWKIHECGSVSGTSKASGTTNTSLLSKKLDCDVLLLTEVKHGTQIPGMRLHASSLDMTTGRWWGRDRKPIADAPTA